MHHLLELWNGWVVKRFCYYIYNMQTYYVANFLAGLNLHIFYLICFSKNVSFCYCKGVGHGTLFWAEEGTNLKTDAVRKFRHLFIYIYGICSQRCINKILFSYWWANAFVDFVSVFQTCAASKIPDHIWTLHL